MLKGSPGEDTEQEERGPTFSEMYENQKRLSNAIFPYWLILVAALVAGKYACDQQSEPSRSSPPRQLSKVTLSR